MKLSQRKLVILIAFLSLLGFFSSVTLVQASILDDFVNGAKNLLSKDKDTKDKKITLDSKIELAPDGDVDKNGQIDAGDIVRFTYTFTNTTEKAYPFTRLKTNTNRNALNFIHNVKGATGLIYNGNTIEIPNLTLMPSQAFTVSFDGRINYYTDKDEVVSTEGELSSNDNKILVKSLRKEIKANKINADKIKSNIKFIRKENIE